MTRSQLKAFRKKHKFTQQKLADRLKVDITTVQRWESGEAGIAYVVELALRQIQQNKKRK